MMNLLSKLTLSVALITIAGSAIAPTTVAEPVLGTTAAAISIKFQDSVPSSGSFSVNTGNGGGATNGNTTGVKEISAAIATGETKATATTASSGNGTAATSEGFSQPVTFKFNTLNTTSSASSIQSNYDYAGSTTGLSFIPVVK
jgi:hypothetical protein